MDCVSAVLRRLTRRCGDADQVRRLLAVAHILDGDGRSEAAKIAGVTLQIVRDWVLRFNEGGPEGLATRKHVLSFAEGVPASSCPSATAKR